LSPTLLIARALTLFFFFADNFTRIVRDYDSQPQIILGAALFAMKTMSSTLWNDIYEDILRVADIISDDYNHTKQMISSALARLNPPQFELVST
jgi:hypothetical protein